MVIIVRNRQKRRKQLVAITLLFSLGLGGCSYDYAVPRRLPGISEGAAWTGGPDGGSWIECFLDQGKNANWCTMWDDQIGDVIARTFFVLRDSGEPATLDELKGAFFDGMYVTLTDGRLLEPLKFHLTEEDEFPPPPIDPPREVPPKIEPENS